MSSDVYLVSDERKQLLNLGKGTLDIIADKYNGYRKKGLFFVREHIEKDLYSLLLSDEWGFAPIDAKHYSTGVAELINEFLPYDRHVLSSSIEEDMPEAKYIIVGSRYTESGIGMPLESYRKMVGVIGANEKYKAAFDTVSKPSKPLQSYQLIREAGGGFDIEFVLNDVYENSYFVQLTKTGLKTARVQITLSPRVEAAYRDIPHVMKVTNIKNKVLGYINIDNAYAEYFDWGQKVYKYSGQSNFVGTYIGAVRTSEGFYRAVVEIPVMEGKGLLHIYSFKDLTDCEPERVAKRRPNWVGGSVISFDYESER